MKMNALFGTALSLAIMSLFGCGGGGGGGAAPAPAGSATISGVAAKGPINGGVIKVYAVTGGVVGTTAIASGSTDVNGNYSININPAPTGPVIVEISGGSFTDEASGTAGVTLKTALRAAVPAVAVGDNKVAVTPLTHLAFKQVEAIGTISVQEITDANIQIGRFFEVTEIITSQPFDTTKDAPAGASDDQKKYAGALGVFSRLVNDRKGSQSLDDALSSVITELETELKDNGGFSGSTVDAVNTAIASFSTSGKNRGGTIPVPVVLQGGVLQLSLNGTLSSGTVVNGIDCTITLPSGITVKSNATTGEADAGVVVPAHQAATNSLTSAIFDKATRKLRIVLINVQPGLTLGEFMHVEFDVDTSAGGVFPTTPTAFVVTPNKIEGGSDPQAASTALTGVGIAGRFAGL